MNDLYIKQSKIFLISSKGCELHSIGLQKAPKSIYKRQSFYQWRQRSSRVQWNRKLDWGVSNYNFSIIMAWGLDSKLLLCFYCMLPCIFFFGPSFASVLQWFSFLEVQGTVIINMIFTFTYKYDFYLFCFCLHVCCCCQLCCRSIYRVVSSTLNYIYLDNVSFRWCQIIDTPSSIIKKKFCFIFF